MVKFVWLSYILKSIFSTVRMVQNQFDQIGCSGNPVQVRDLHVLQCVYIYIYVYIIYMYTLDVKPRCYSATGLGHTTTVLQDQQALYTHCNVHR